MWFIAQSEHNVEATANKCKHIMFMEHAQTIFSNLYNSRIDRSIKWLQVT